MASEIAAAVQKRVPRFAAPRLQPRVLEAVTVAMNRFLDALDGAPHRDRGADEIFRELGRAEAAAGRTLADLQAAAHVAVTAVWEQMRQADLQAADGADTRAGLADTVFAFIDHLIQQAETGHEEVTRRRAADPVRARAQLAERLLNGAALPKNSELLWPIPARTVVLVVELDEGERPEIAGVAPDCLVVRHDRRLVVLAAAEDRSRVERALLDSTRGRIAVSWGVDRTAVREAFAWTRRALDLVRRGVIPEGRVIECAEHRTQIWLHSQPALRQQLCQDLLRPLLAETPNSREILSETLLVWLETRDSAPAIAAQLGVHAQTVRYRWKRINELFGDALREPEFIVQITMLLKASVPLWKAGDQSDFERFQTETDA